MAMVDVVTCCLQADLRLKSVGLVQRSAAVWRCSAFIAWTQWTHAMTLSHDVSTINIVLVIIIIIFYYYYSVVDDAGKDLVPEPADQVEEAESRPGYQLPHSQSSISSVHRLICIQPAVHGCGRCRTALWTNRTSSVPQRIAIVWTVFSGACAVHGSTCC